MHEIMETALKPFMPPQFKEGDIFHWRFKPDVETKRRNYSSDPYHCKSRIAVVKDGILQDTFWYGGSDNAVLRQDDITLEYQGNPSDMTVIPESEKVFYRHEDLVDMNHSNNSRAPVYVKAGKSRDRETMRAYFSCKIERAESDIRSANSRISELRNALKTIESGTTSGSFPIYR